MIYIINLCDFPLCILPWLLSGLLGFLAGYFWMARWKSKYTEMEDKYNALVKTNKGITSDLKDCTHNRAVLEGDIATANGRVKEMEVRMKNAEAKAAAANVQSKSSIDASAIVSGLAATSTLEVTASGSGKSDSAYASLKSSNLQIIEGIGPKMEEVLQKAGMKKWSDLAASNPTALRGILDTYGDKYKIINPESWAQQAGLAATSKWDELILLQKQLDTGVDSNINLTDSKLEKLILKSSKGGFSKFKKNDLKIVEGIGPKIAELLNNSGINTWEELANAGAAKIQEILDSAGSKFKLAKPGSWSKQARLAADGSWNALRDLQDVLDGGV